MRDVALQENYIQLINHLCLNFSKIVIIFIKIKMKNVAT